MGLVKMCFLAVAFSHSFGPCICITLQLAQPRGQDPCLHHFGLTPSRIPVNHGIFLSALSCNCKPHTTPRSMQELMSTPLGETHSETFSYLQTEKEEKRPKPGDRTSTSG